VKDNIYTIAYAAALGLVCALTLTGVGEMTRDRIRANSDAEENRNILAVLGVPFEPTASAEDLVAVFEQNVRKVDDEDLALYQYVPAGTETAEATAVLFGGPGLWGPVEGFLSLEPDMVTIRGVTFHKQEETPGLGGEIAGEKFCGSFVGKRIVDAEGKPRLRILRGEGNVTSDVEVDGISGATMTCDKVQDMLYSVIEKIAQRGGANGQ
jgi:Na+-transporting NADH:ubiquinone oxidoreductase subunit C